MPAQTQKTRQSTKTAEPEVEETTAATETEDDFNVDAILDEIDGVLEENAEEFVKSYVQKGGE